MYPLFVMDSQVGLLPNGAYCINMIVIQENSAPFEISLIFRGEDALEYFCQKIIKSLEKQKLTEIPKIFLDMDNGKTDAF